MSIHCLPSSTWDDDQTFHTNLSEHSPGRWHVDADRVADLPKPASFDPTKSNHQAMKTRLAALWGSDTEAALQSMAATLAEEGVASGILYLDPEEGCGLKGRYFGSMKDHPETGLTFSSIGFCSCGLCRTKTSVDEMSYRGFRVEESKDETGRPSGMIYFGTLHIGSQECDLVCKAQI